MAGFAELAARSHYSFLEGSASPRTLVAAARELGIEALGLCDRNGLYGAVGFLEAARKAGIRGVIGAELDLDDGDRLRLVARNRDGYRQLSRAISAAQLAGVKGQPRLRLLGLVAGTAPKDRSEERRVGKEGRYWRDWSSDVCSSDLYRQLSRAISAAQLAGVKGQPRLRLLGLVAGTAAKDAPTPRRRRPTLPPPQ